jgi:hypothetical protein
MAKPLKAFLGIIAFIILLMLWSSYLPEVSAAFWSSILRNAWSVWWLIVCIPLMVMFQQTWLYWRQEHFKATEFNQVLLEIRIPREITKTPRGMEQALYSIHQLVNAPGDFEEFYLQGEVTRWYSLEIVSFGGETHFYVWVYKTQKPLVEAAIVSYYPDIEVAEVDDYVKRFPANVQEMYAQGYNCWGAEMIYGGKADYYPIRTYKDFEAPVEENQIDPMSSLLEVFAKLQPSEIIAIQLIIQPLHNKSWIHVYPHALEDLKKEFQKITVEHSVGKEGEQIEKLAKAFSTRSPGETDIMKAVEEKLSKPIFKTLIRFIYLSPKTIFKDSIPRRAMMGAFNQYAGLDMNFFTRNDGTGTRVRFWNGWPYLFPNLRNEYRKQRLLYNYPRRKMSMHSFMARFISSHPLNMNFASKEFFMGPEELATFFHPPTNYVLTAPHIQRMESRKYAPPAGMAIYGDESDIEKFK